MAMNKPNKNILETEFIYFSNWIDDNLVFKKTEITCNEYAKFLGIIPDENLTYVFCVQQVLNKLAKHASTINRMRHFTSRFVIIRFFNTYMKPIIRYGMLI